MALHTAGAAHQLHDGNSGTVCPGKRADLIVLDRDITKVPVKEIRATKVQYTLVSGRVVHDAQSDTGRARVEAAQRIARTAEFARNVENAGAASLWVGDHNLAAVNPKVGYGGQGNTIPAELNPAADPFVLLGIAASATERVLLGAHVLIAPLYPPVQLARSLTSIDLISGGRLLPGFGIGWSPEEYEAAGGDFTRRGARMNELLDALEAIWTTDPAAYQGESISVPLHHSPLKPARRPRPPFYLGALSERALRRVAERGDGWLPLCVVPSYLDIDGLVAQRAVIDRLAQEAGRDPSAIDAVLRVNIDPDTSSQQVADALKAVHERTSIDHFMIDSMYAVHSVDGAIAFAAELIELAGKG